MSERKNLGFIVGGLAVVVLVLVGLLIRFERHRPDSKNETKINQELADDVKLVADFTALTAETAPDDRVVLYGDTLVSLENAAMVEELKNGLHRPVEVITAETASSTDALIKLRQTLQHPPKILIMDLSRYDDAAKISLDRSAANISLIDEKAKQLGIVPIFLIGPSSEGVTTYAETLRMSVTGEAKFFDTSTMLQISKYRISPTSLNTLGSKTLGTELVKLLNQMLTS